MILLRYYEWSDAVVVSSRVSLRLLAGKGFLIGMRIELFCALYKWSNKRWDGKFCR